MRRTTISAVALGMLLAAPAAEADVLVRFKPGTSAAERAAARADAGVRRERGLAVDGLEAVSGGPAAAAALRRAPEVLYAEPDRLRRTALLPSDMLFATQWGLERIAAPAAWETTTGSAGVTVAVADTGADLDHPDLAPNLVRGWDFVDEDGAPTDEDRSGHGTLVAGIVGARGDDGVGVAGVAWHTRVQPLRVLDADGRGRVSDAIRAYGYAAASGARVVNLSLLGERPSQAERDALAAAPDVLFVAAAGNAGADVDVRPTYPCAYTLPNVLCVTAADHADGRPAFANVGARTVDVAAPGVAISGPVPDDTWGARSGTSMAAPHVSGAAALLLAHEPAARPSDLIAALVGTAAPTPAFAGRIVSGGRLDVAAALRAVRATAAPVLTPPPPRVPTPAPPVAPPAPAPPSPRATPAVPGHAKLKLRRAAIRDGRLNVLARITRGASGEVAVSYRADGRTLRFRTAIERGSIRFTRRLPRAQRRGGLLSVRWGGSATVRPAGFRLRAAEQPARLRRGQVSLRDGRLRAEGRISRRARGVVRLALAAADGSVHTFKARIRSGRWRLSAPVAAPRGYLSIQFTGYRGARGGPMRGEQDGIAVG